MLKSLLQATLAGLLALAFVTACATARKWVVRNNLHQQQP